MVKFSRQQSLWLALTSIFCQIGNYVGCSLFDAEGLIWWTSTRNRRYMFVLAALSLAILEFFQKFVDSVGSKLEFIVDDISTGDPNAAGVTWHLEWNGKPFPLSKGCSFYRCQVYNGKRQFVDYSSYGRDAVEP